jgi:molybdopterin converting factor small subunit
MRISIASSLRGLCGGNSVIEAEGESVGEVLANAALAWPELGVALLGDSGKLHRYVNVYLDDDDVRYLGALKAPTSGYKEMALLPAVAGGS